jgi:hypothetical protein
VHDLGLGDARELRATLGEASYEVPERLARVDVDALAGLFA